MPESDIALITLDVPGKGANVLSQRVLEAFEQNLAELEQRSGLAGIIIMSGKPGTFIAGADIREFAAAQGISREQTIELATRGRQLFSRLSKTSAVTIAAIDGICVGGGAELAVWCDRRLMSDNPKTQIGFPEVKLGLFPGWGGTVRTPRIVGLGNAVELVTSGESIDARAAVLMELATDAVPAEKLLDAAIALVRAEQMSQQFLRDRERWQQPIEISETELYFLGATATGYIQQQTKGQYPAPLAALNLMLESALVDADEAGTQEAEAFAELFGTPINRSLINVFLLTDRNKKDPGIERRDVQPRSIETVGVVGAGIMGSGIAAASVKRSLPVTITDASREALAAGVQKALEEVSYNKLTRGTDVQRTLQFAPLLNATSVDAEFGACDLVIEAIIENLDIKRQLYGRLEPQLNDTAILASNTSAISIGQLAQGLKRPEQFCGIHFFNPVRKMPLVEVIRGPKSSDETIATAVAYAKAIGKSPIVVNDGPGFLVNRLLMPYMTEALELVREGVEIKRIERAAKNFGMPMGPITLYDVVGLDTALFVGQVMKQGFPDRFIQSPVLEAMVKAGRKGQKSGSGFFKYAPGKPKGEPDPTLEEVLRPAIAPSGAKLSDQQITERLFLPMVLEATRVLADGTVRDPRDVDLGLIYGIGFPPFQGGLLFWADTLGAKKIIDMLKPYQAIGQRFQPTPMLVEMAQSGTTFYSQA